MQQSTNWNTKKTDVIAVVFLGHGWTWYSILNAWVWYLRYLKETYESKLSIHAHWGVCVGCIDHRTVNESWIRKARILHLDECPNAKQALLQWQVQHAWPKNSKCPFDQTLNLLFLDNARFHYDFDRIAVHFTPCLVKQYLLSAFYKIVRWLFHRHCLSDQYCFLLCDQGRRHHKA